jgi:hypothetical protein
MKRLTAAVTFVVVAVLAPQVSALECIPIPLKTSLAQAEIVVLGEVESVRYATTPERPTGASHYIATVRVKKLWKGSTPTTIELHQPWIGGGMDLHQQVGVHYLFFVWQLTPDHPLTNPPAPPVTSGYRAAECISKRVSSSYDSRELGKSYPPTP